MNFSESDIERYSRNILLNEVGGVGQKKISKSKVLVIGAGGLGSPLLLYLAASGVGTIGIIDDDIVELSNLQRQIIHNTESLNFSKVKSAKFNIEQINPNINIIIYDNRLSNSNAENIIKNFDIIADGSDNFETRFLVNDISFKLKKILVSAAVQRFDIQLSSFNFKNNKISPCYRCIIPNSNSIEDIDNCNQSGVLGSVVGIAGCLQATEIIKIIIETKNNLIGKLLIIDTLNNEFRTLSVKKDPECFFCSNLAFNKV
ncbi:molybdopterin-synthase adenylyltransferase MoeB [Alphaproteobacteria bacterium]|nr:molybdopterin-synthase adenylyltransferase MoeB [Alphaproteobacteria bacterium]